MDKIRCPRCGKANYTWEAACASCGAVLHTAAPGPTAFQPPRRTGVWDILPFVPLVVGLILVPLPGYEVAGTLLAMFAWPLPIFVIGLRRGCGAAGDTALVMGLSLFGVIALLIPASRRFGDVDLMGLGYVLLAVVELGLGVLALSVCLGVLALVLRRRGGRVGLVVSTLLLLAAGVLWLVETMSLRATAP